MAEKISDELFFDLVREELIHARREFPGANATHAALVEEVGETSKALMYEPWGNVVAECVQVATRAVRLATEGDATMSQFRRSQTLDDIVKGE